MKACIVDTSVWIDFFNGKNNRAVNTVALRISNDDSVFLSPTILQEVLQGIRDDASFIEVKQAITGFGILEMNQTDAAIQAAELYRSIRKMGITIRKSNDCLIAAYAIHFGIALLHNDRDFDLIAKYSSLKIFHFE